jgi:hypothetical protein
MDPIFSAGFTMPEAAPKPGGMFGGGGDWRSALMAAGAAMMSRRNPQMATGIMQMMMLKQRQAQEEAHYERERHDKQDDWRTQYDYEVAHPKQTDPHYFQDNAGNQMAIGSDGKPVEVYHDPFQYKLVPNGMGGVVPVNIQELMRGGQGSAPKPVGKITPINGGPSPSGSGGFPY